MRTEKIKQNTSGQAILIVVVFMGAIMVGISVISGYLLTQRLKTSVDIINSTKAIYAADAGIEAQLYDIFKNGGADTTDPKTLPATSVSGGASYDARRTDNGTGFDISSLGTYQKPDGRSISRQLFLRLNFR